MLHQTNCRQSHWKFQWHLVLEVYLIRTTINGLLYQTTKLVLHTWLSVTCKCELLGYAWLYEIGNSDLLESRPIFGNQSELFWSNTSDFRNILRQIVTHTLKKCIGNLSYSKNMAFYRGTEDMQKDTWHTHKEILQNLK